MTKKLPFYIRHFKVILIVILFIKIGGHFSIVEERSVNQIFKTISRMSMTGLTILLGIKLKRFGFKTAIRFEYILPMTLYIMYLLLGLASLGWSSNWQYSGLQWLMTSECFVFVILYTRLFNVYNENLPSNKLNLVEIFSKAIFPIMLIFIIGSFVEPDTFFRSMRGGGEQRLGGWIMNPNELGMLAVIGASLAFIRVQDNQQRFWSFLAMIAAVYVLLLTSSRSSVIGFALITGILVLQSTNKKMKIAMIVISLIGLPFVLKAVVFKDDGGIEEVMSMTGRLPFWTALLNEGIVKEPWLGYGFMRINYTDYFQGLNTYPGKMTHNTFMQVLMNLGFIGFFIAFWQVITTVKTYFFHRKHLHSKFFIAIFIPVIINSFTEFGVFGESNYGILFYQFLIILFSVKLSTNFSTAEKIRIRIRDKKLKKFIG